MVVLFVIWVSFSPLSAGECARVAPGTPFVRPQNPGALNIHAGTAPHAATRMQEDHAEELCQHRECLNVKVALK